VEKVFINSLPKSGTNLVAKLTELVGYNYNKVGIAATLLLGKYFLLRQILRGDICDRNPIIIGLDLPIAVSSKWIKKKFSNLPSGEFISGHANYSDHLYYILQEKNIKTIQVIRDPRDVLLSYVHYVAKTPSHFIYDFYKNKSFDERLKFTLEGGKAGDLYVESFSEMLNKVDGWFNKNNVLIVKFEDIIGENGGGSREIQIKTIDEIIDFLSIKNSSSVTAADQLFGGTHTFRKGQIGSWKDELTQEQILFVAKHLNVHTEKWGYEI